MANFIVLFNSSLLILLIIFSIRGFDDNKNVKIIDNIMAILASQIITKTQRKNVAIAASSEVSPSCFCLNEV